MKYRGGIWIGLAVGLLTAALALIRPAFLEDLERELLDLRFRLRGPAPVSGQVMVVAVDAESIDRIGRWPWPREEIARLLDRICEAGASAVAFDIVFSEPQREPGRQFAERLGTLPDLPPSARDLVEEGLSRPSGDARLAGAVRNCADRTVLGYFFRDRADMAAGVQDPDAFAGSAVGLVRIAPDLEPEIPRAAAVENNIPTLFEAAAHHGFFNTEPDGDGQLRHYQLIWGFGDSYFTSLAVEAVRVARGNPLVAFELSATGKAGLRIGTEEVAADEDGRQLLDFRGPGNTLPHVSALSILEGRETAALQGKILFVGVTEVGIKDVRPTAFDRLFPGTEVHATAADSILRGQYLRRSGNHGVLDLAVAFFSPLLVSILLQLFRRPLNSLVATLLVIAGFAAANQFVFARLHVWSYAVYPFVGIATTWAGVTLYRLLTTEHRARQIRDVFQKYVDASVVEEMLGDPSRVRLGGERRELTILFSDIRGFTSLSETMDPQELVVFLNTYFTPMTRIILEHRGTLDKYMGDALMAFWGAPLPMEDHAAAACRAALAMQAQLLRMKAESSLPGIASMDIGIGIHTGPVSVGNMGSEQIYDYTVIGDSANLASRLEGANKIYGTRILISESTARAAAEEGFLTRHLDRVRVKGKEEPVEILELVGSGPGDATAVPITPFEAALGCYYSGRFDEASRAFEAILGDFPQDEPSRLYLERCRQFLESPPPEGWDGVFVMSTK